MTEILRTKSVKAGAWRTLEYGWNATFACVFQLPVGAQVKIRYGDGRYLGWDSQRQTLDGTVRLLNVTTASLAYARVQISVQNDTTVTYTYIPVGP